jgi:hypothetical protein
MELKMRVQLKQNKKNSQNIQTMSILTPYHLVKIFRLLVFWRPVSWQQHIYWEHVAVAVNTLAAHGLEEPFFQLCCCVSFWFWQEVGFGLHTYVLRVPYSCGVVSVFVLRREIVFGTYVLTIQLLCCVSFFGSGGKYFLMLRTYIVYNTVVQLCS